MLVIRLFRTGKKNQPFFKIVVTDKRRPPKGGRFVEQVGFINPLTKDKNLKTERLKYWLSVGAKTSNTVHNLLVREGIIKDKKIPVHKKKKEKKGTEPKPEKPEEKKPEETKTAEPAPLPTPETKEAKEEDKSPKVGPSEAEEVKPEEPAQQEKKSEQSVKQEEGAEPKEDKEKPVSAEPEKDKIAKP